MSFFPGSPFVGLANMPVAAGGGESGPTPLAVADFKNGSYSINGATVTAAQFLLEGSYMEAISPGVGLTDGTVLPGDSVMTEISGEFTVVFQINFSSSETSPWNTVMHVGADGYGNNTFSISQHNEVLSTANVSLTGDPQIWFESAISVGISKIALMFDDATGFISIDGGVAHDTPTGLPGIEFMEIAGGPILIIESLIFYPVVDAATLQALSV